MTDNFTNTIPTLSMKLLASLLRTGWCIWVLNTETINYYFMKKQKRAKLSKNVQLFLIMYG